MPNKIIPYNPKLKALARLLRKQRILSEVLLWKALKGKALKIEFHRQVPMLEYIVDFYCHELMLAIEIDGSSHDYEETQINDSMRQSSLENLGVTFLRFSDKEIRYDLQNVLLAIDLKIEMLRGI